MPFIARAELSGALGALAVLALLALSALSGAGCAMGDTTDPSGTGGHGVGDASGGVGSIGSWSPSSPASTGTGAYGASGTTSDCKHTTDGFSFTLTEAEGQTYGCDGVTGKLSLSAQVTAVLTKTSALLAACPEASGCTGTAVTLSVTSEDLPIALVPGAFVSIDALVQKTDAGCTRSLLIANLPSLDGVKNPVTTAPILLLAGADGTLATPSGSGLKVGDAVGCGAETYVGAAGVVDDKLSFSFAGVTTAAVTLDLPMGVPYPVQAPDGGVWLLINLRSFHHLGAVAGDQKDFAYWVSYSPPGP